MDYRKIKTKTMSKKQTSIEWFAEQLGIKSGTMLEQAKAMHKEEIIDAYDTAYMRVNSFITPK